MPANRIIKREAIKTQRGWCNHWFVKWTINNFVRQLTWNKNVVYFFQKKSQNWCFNWKHLKIANHPLKEALDWKCNLKNVLVYSGGKVYKFCFHRICAFISHCPPNLELSACQGAQGEGALNCRHTTMCAHNPKTVINDHWWPYE